jgi:murein DD-endopeptidase MepM/ murein hydrolase activator NlpD
VHSIYTNLAEQPPVSQGDVVSMGQIIGSVGGTALGETNTVPHLHFAMTCDGLSADPSGYLATDVEWLSN